MKRSRKQVVRLALNYDLGYLFYYNKMDDRKMKKNAEV
jgi:hypothetical protein